MGVDVKKFIDRLHEKKGKLGEWEASIFELLTAKVTYGQIVEFLKENGVKANPMEVHRFVHRKKRKHLLDAVSSPKTVLPPKTPGKVAVEKQVPAEPATQTPDKIEPEKTQGNEPAPGELPKFDWQSERGKKNFKW